ncbi:MAG TPA: HEAT repeat domain-containing protein [Gemmatimonadaceae bacterium]|nr:HEAT repeat domain-containing protein [Gemmatimonadaceae bacterium]
MKCITLSMMLTWTAAAAVAAAQTPPAPVPPVQPAQPAPAPRALRAVRVPPRGFGEMELEEMSAADRAMRPLAIAPMARVERMAEMAQMAPMAPMAPIEPMPAMAIDMGFGPRGPVAVRVDRFERQMPPPGWAQGDPADSLYNRAREVVGRGDWGRAAQMFADLQKNYPKSAYEKDSQYWEAFARYKIGTTDQLKQASKILEPLASQLSPSNGGSFAFRNGRRTSDNEILALYARINGVLAQRGDSDAAAKVAKAAAAQGAPCDQEEITVRTEALNALSQMDPSQAMQLLRRVLDRKDECSSQLRRNAVFILGRRADADASALLLQVAKSDPDVSVRSEAVSYLARTPGDAGINALEDILKTEQDERIQRAAVRALMSSDNARARASMRSLIDRKDAPLNLRIEAIGSFNSERASSDDAAYLRGLYGRADNDRIKEAVVSALSRMGGTENDQFLLGIIRNSNEPSAARSAALARLARSPSTTTADIVKLYDASAESYEVRTRLISILGNRKDQESTDKLIDIVKNSTVINHRTQAINALMNKKDPRATQALTDVLDGKKP